MPETKKPSKSPLFRKKKTNVHPNRRPKWQNQRPKGPPHPAHQTSSAEACLRQSRYCPPPKLWPNPPPNERHTRRAIPVGHGMPRRCCRLIERECPIAYVSSISRIPCIPAVSDRRRAHGGGPMLPRDTSEDAVRRPHHPMFGFRLRLVSGSIRCCCERTRWLI